MFGRSPFQIYSAQLLEELPFPERALIVKINCGVQMRMCSFHTPPGVRWGKIKPQTLRAIAEWLAQQSGHTIFGIDAMLRKRITPCSTKTSGGGRMSLLCLDTRRSTSYAIAFDCI